MRTWWHTLHAKAQPSVDTIYIRSLSQPATRWVASQDHFNYVVQGGLFAGYRVVGIASKRNHAFLQQSLGVDSLVDYHDSDYVEQLARDPGNANLAHVFDAVGDRGDSSGGVTQRCFDILQACSGKPGKVVTVMPGQPDFEGLPPEQVRQRSYKLPSWQQPALHASRKIHMMYTSIAIWCGPLVEVCLKPSVPPDASKWYGSSLQQTCSVGLADVQSYAAVQFGSILDLHHVYDEGDRALGRIMGEISSRLNAGQLVPSRARKLEGLEAGGKEGLQLLVDHKLSAEKAVVHVSTSG